MEIFLLLLDELDDYVVVARRLARPTMGFLTALLLFGATIYLLVQLPVLAIALFAASLWLLFVAVQARSRVVPLALDSER